VSGSSFGGIQRLLTAEKRLGARAFVAFASAAQSWDNGALDRSLEYAVEPVGRFALIPEPSREHIQ
jgi:hypothetical protein